MTLRRDQRADRLEKRLKELKLWTVRSAKALNDWTFNGHPLAEGEPWPLRDGLANLEHQQIAVPSDWPLEETRLDLDLGGEGLLRLDYDGGGEAAFGLDVNHQRFPLTGRRFSVRAECVARLPFGVPNRDARLSRAQLSWVDRELCEYCGLLELLVEVVRCLGDHEAVEPMLDAGEASVRKLDWPTETATYVARAAPGEQLQKVWQLPDGIAPDPDGLDDDERASVVEATRSLTGDLEALRERYPQSGALALSGHAHIDLAWLWPMEETRRKANRTFHTMVGLMERHPDFRFNQSTAQLYDFLAADDPALFAEIADKVKGGQWEPIGAMWVEPDTNMPTGESFVRQLLYAQRYFERTFGRRHTVCWLPDCFGFSPALPQLLRLASVDSFFTIKVNWSETNAMPYDLFWWEGLDGSRVLAHTFSNPVGGYNAEIGARAIVETWRNFRGKHLFGESLLSFGYGDGGGGPTEDMLDRQQRLAAFPVVPRMRPVGVAEWFDELHKAVADREDIPVWVGEMYLELHRGTLTTQGRTKRLHRRAERALITAETVSGMAAMLGGPMPASLEEHWRVVLRNQFHDILPGSSIREVYDQAEDELAAVVEAGDAVTGERLGAIAEELAKHGGEPGLLVVNPDLSPRPLRLVVDDDWPGGQPVEGGTAIAADAAVPGLHATIMASAPPAEGLAADRNRLENAQVRVEIADDGTLTSVLDKQAGREALAGRGNQLWAYVDKPRNWDAWDVEDDYATQGEEIAASGIELVESGPHRAAIAIERPFRSSRIRQIIRLWANSARVDFVTDIEWHERRILLKARFPLAIRSQRAVFECAHGVVERPTHRNTSWDAAKFEVAGHRFADLSEQDYGVALINDGKYGHHALGNELGLSLLRSPVYPDPLADEGRHQFTYALFPHRGDWLTGGVLAEAEDLNRPLLGRAVRAGAGAAWTAVGIDGLRLGLSALKAAEDGSALILRCYEPAGARGTADMSLPDGWRLEGEVNLLEEATGAAEPWFKPFQVHSWRLAR